MTIQGINCKIVEKQGKIVLIEVENQRIKVPREFLPPSANPGNDLKLFILNSEDGQNFQKKLAKSILEEILNGK